MVSLQNVSISFKEKQIIKNASALFTASTSNAIIGRNGAGKSTLLRAIAGIGKYQEGIISIDNKDISSLKQVAIGRLISFVNTERIRIPRFSCREIVALGRTPYTDWIGRLSKRDNEIIENSLALVGMADFADRSMQTMSDGECQRVMIARALAQDTPTILLDEPTSFLDMPSRYELCSLLSELAHSQGKCIIYSSHELDIVLNLSDNIALIDNTNLLQMSTQEMKKSGIIKSVFNI